MILGSEGTTSTNKVWKRLFQHLLGLLQKFWHWEQCRLLVLVSHCHSKQVTLVYPAKSPAVGLGCCGLGSWDWGSREGSAQQMQEGLHMAQTSRSLFQLVGSTWVLDDGPLLMQVKTPYTPPAQYREKGKFPTSFRMSRIISPSSQKHPSM